MPLLTLKKVTDSTNLFTQNSSKGENINPGDRKTIFSYTGLSGIFNQILSNVVPDLNKLKPNFCLGKSKSWSFYVHVRSSDKHPGIVKIKRKKFESTVHFRKTNSNVVEKNGSNLNVKKSSQQKYVLTKNIKLTKDLIVEFISEDFNSCIDKGEFASVLKSNYCSKRKTEKLISV